MSPDDEAIIAKAAMLGCTFTRSTRADNKRWYCGLAPQHPLAKAKHAIDGFYGYDDPVKLAHAYVNYFTKVPNADA